METHPCMTCGACCACFRASFYWTESDLATPDGVPHELTDHLQSHFLVMKGTERVAPRCIALAGTIGVQVRCTIYESRPSACRNFTPSMEDGTTLNERCDMARRQWGMPPLTAACRGGTDEKSQGDGSGTINGEKLQAGPFDPFGTDPRLL